jgi:hypothetical protein
MRQNRPRNRADFAGIIREKSGARDCLRSPGTVAEPRLNRSPAMSHDGMFVNLPAKRVT